jgi:hypothetical protein
VPPSPATLLSAEERRQLKCFVRLVEEMLDSRFYRRVPEMDHSLSYSVSPEGEPQFKTPDYDWEDARSFLATFRQIAVNEMDSVYITRIRNIVSQHAGPSFQADLRVLKSHVVRVLSGKHGMASLGITTNAGQVQHLSGAAILDALVNGEVFHSGADFEQTIEQLHELPRGSYLWLVLFDVINPILHACWFLRNVIVSANLLAREDLPEGLLASWDAWQRGHSPPFAADREPSPPSP